MQINSQPYWDERFRTGFWEAVGGRQQTAQFAWAQARRMPVPAAFGGSILDFGCGLGDAIPVYRRFWPAATLAGADFAESAIAAARERYGDWARFHIADHVTCPPSDVIITSNVLEHLENDTDVVRALIDKCGDLFVTVPYDEQYLIDEHRRRYTRESFAEFAPKIISIFPSAGWSQFGLQQCWYEIYLKNLLRPLFGKSIVRRRLQIMYHIAGRHRG
jgi:SAM-dependent methyltransferase